jgi:acyl transferase domain-containing protein
MFVNVDPKDIDAGFFGLSQVDAVSMDPQQRQLLEVVYEGLENAGLTLEELRSKLFGCFVGSYASGTSPLIPVIDNDDAPEIKRGKANMCSVPLFSFAARLQRYASQKPGG